MIGSTAPCLWSVPLNPGREWHWRIGEKYINIENTSTGVYLGVSLVVNQGCNRQGALLCALRLAT